MELKILLHWPQNHITSIKPCYIFKNHHKYCSSSIKQACQLQGILMLHTGHHPNLNMKLRVSLFVAATKLISQHKVNSLHSYGICLVLQQLRALYNKS